MTQNTKYDRALSERSPPSKLNATVRSGSSAWQVHFIPLFDKNKMPLPILKQREEMYHSAPAEG